MSEQPSESARDMQTPEGPGEIESAAQAAGDPALAARIRRLETPGAFAIMAIYVGLFTLTWLLSFVYLGVRWAIE